MGNFNSEMYGYGSKRSAIRELFEFGKKRRAELGADKVFDFSLGNPSIPAPSAVTEAIVELSSELDPCQLHGYTSAQGDIAVRNAISENLNKRFAAGLNADNIYMTCGAAASLCISFKAMCCENDEIIILAPFFPEYTVFVKSAGATPVIVGYDKKNFQIDFEALEKAITAHTKAIIINSPNNPSGVVYTRETLEKLAALLHAKSTEYGHAIFIVSDEPYRELVYGDVEVPFIMNIYDNSVVCYSFSKSLSLPGERIGYIAVCPRAEGSGELYAAICGAGRALGYVCAPSLFQRVIAKCLDIKPDVEAYRRNRDLLYSGLQEIGYDCVHPDGAFYLFVKSLSPDAEEFAERAKNLGLLLVPGNSFGSDDYVRIAYCVSYDMIERSMPAFRELYQSYK